jgi:hypothetical protein
MMYFMGSFTLFFYYKNHFEDEIFDSGTLFNKFKGVAIYLTGGFVFE